MQFASTPPMRWMDTAPLSIRDLVATRVCFVAQLEHTPYGRELVYRQRPQDDGTYYAHPPAPQYP